MSNVTLRKRNRLGVWKDVIFALFTREIRTGFNDKFGLSWAIINPVVFIFVLSSIREVVNGAYTHTLTTFVFMAIGTLFILSFLKTFSAAAKSIIKNKALFAFRQVQPISATIAAGLFALMVKVVSLIGLLVIMYFLDKDISVNNGLLFIYAFFTISLIAVAAGLLFGIGELYVSEIAKVRELATRPLFFISGAFFSLQDIPQQYWVYLNWNPILHAIEIARFSVTPTYGLYGVSPVYLGASLLVSLGIALTIYFVSWKQAISR